MVDLIKSVSILHDKRINAYSILIEMKICDYLKLAKAVLNRNIYQRRRVKSSASVYSLLKEDLRLGCIIPPIVLALHEIPFTEINSASEEDVLANLVKHEDKLLILDGLQRTYTMVDLEKELKEKDDLNTLNDFHNSKIRTEIYLGINKIGVLYRMLTLNTGQTPMSLRHQVEILYLDYLDKEVDGVTLLREIEDTAPATVGQYNFKDVIEGFNSYLDRNELPIDRFDLLENIRGLEKLSKENQDEDLFRDFVSSYNKIVKKLKDLSAEWEYDSGLNEADLTGQAFGRNVIKIFNKSQAMTGFGAAIGKLRDFKLIVGFEDLNKITAELVISDIEGTFNNLLRKLDYIRQNSTKIGNAQRMFFQYLFRELFNRESDSFKLFDSAVDNAFQKYLSQTT
jgi:hypothetical protein